MYFCCCANPRQFNFLTNYVSVIYSCKHGVDRVNYTVLQQVGYFILHRTKGHKGLHIDFGKKYLHKTQEN